MRLRSLVIFVCAFVTLPCVDAEIPLPITPIRPAIAKISSDGKLVFVVRSIHPRFVEETKELPNQIVAYTREEYGWELHRVTVEKDYLITRIGSEEEDEKARAQLAEPTPVLIAEYEPPHDPGLQHFVSPDMIVVHVIPGAERTWSMISAYNMPQDIPPARLEEEVSETPLRDS